MFLPRVIPCLLLHKHALVKSIKFDNYTYVGDPINAIKIFNEKEVDELIFLDIDATKEKRKPDFNLIKQIAGECFMPLCYGGGINSVEDVQRLFEIGIEKVAINSYAAENQEFIAELSSCVGSQSIVVAIDLKRSLFGQYNVYSHAGKIKTNLDLIEYVKKIEAMGAGELLINSIDRDGTMIGFDLDLIKTVSCAVSIPVIAMGGLGKLDDFSSAIQAGASAVAAGSLFVFYGKHRAVLINYPKIELLRETFNGCK
jgi:cyclase